MRKKLKDWWGPELNDWLRDVFDKSAMYELLHPQLYGVERVLLGGLMLVVTGQTKGWLHVSDTLLLTAVVVTVVLAALLHLYAFGGWPPSIAQLQSTSFMRANLKEIPSAITCGAAFAGYFLAIIFFGYIDWYKQWSVSMVGLWLAAGLVAWHGLLSRIPPRALPEDYEPAGFDFRPEETDYRHHIYRRSLPARYLSHYLVMAGIVALTSLIPLLGILPSYRLYANAAVLGVTMSLVLIVGGILDRRFLNRLKG